MPTILLVDDEPNFHPTLKVLFKHAGWETLSAYSGREAWEIFLEREDIDLVLTDMTMPDGGGLELVERLKEKSPDVPVILLTAYGTVELAVEAIKLGAFDYLTKPWKNEKLLKVIANALELSRLSRENRKLKTDLTRRYSFGSLIGKSEPMLELYQLLEKVAPTKANVLITGESGTGKELVAQALHHNSPRAGEPFVAVNCSALSSTLLESELFGHEKGAFTDARQSRAGRFELADRGTLFLDEIGETDPSLQVKLLRVLQERRFWRVGGVQPLDVDVRLIAATNRDLKKEIAERRFREDLFYRLNVVHLILPPLRERLTDLPLLADHFLKKYGLEQGRSGVGLSLEALRLMYAYSWPGNVRELENVIERGLVLSSGPEIKSEDLPEEIRQIQENSVQLGELAPRQVKEKHQDPYRGPKTAEHPPSPVPDSGWIEEIISSLPAGRTLDETLQALEEGLVRRELETAGGVQSQAAAALGLKKNVFKYKWDKYIDLAPTPLSADLAQSVPPGSHLNPALETLEEHLLGRALREAGGIQSQAAEALGIKKNLMQYKLKKYPGLKEN